MGTSKKLRNGNKASSPPQPRVAVRIEVDQLYVHLKQGLHHPDPTGALLDLLPRLLTAVEERTGGRITIREVYADFSRLTGLQNPLYALGITSLHVPCRPRKSSVDMAICIAVTDALHLDPHLGIEVLGAGDADYGPLVHRLQKHGREIWLVAFGPTIAADLREAVGSKHIIDAADYLIPAPSAESPNDHTDLELSREVISSMIEDFVFAKGYQEVYAGPFRTHFLKEHGISQAQFAAAIHLLELEGVLTAVKRPKRENDDTYTVWIPNPEHRLVRALTGSRIWPLRRGAAARAA